MTARLAIVSASLVLVAGCSPYGRTVREPMPLARATS
jgi:hypothetical protein